MLILKIKDRGHFINIPGMAPMRTPVNIKADKLDLRLAELALRKANIRNYEIVAVEEVHEPKKEEIKYVEIPVKEAPQDDRIEKLEKMMELLLARELEKPVQKREQISKQLEDLEKLLTGISGKESIVVEKDSPIVEEIDELYIPRVDTNGMKMKGEATKKTVKQDKGDRDEEADLLSRLLVNNKGEL